MKKIERVSYSDLETAAVKNGYVLEDVINGCLVDSLLYVKCSKKPGYNDIYIAAFETYLNSWSSCLTVYIARTENDIQKLLALWDKRKETEETETAS